MKRLVPIAVLLVAAPARASWLGQRAVLQLDGGGAWRVALGGDARVPGFMALTGGAEVVLGLQVGGGFALALDGHGRFGSTGAGASYWEVAGGPALQWWGGGRARLRLGGDGGMAAVGATQAPIAGGFVECAVDVLPLRAAALTLTVRLDLDAFVGATDGLPDGSMALGVGLGGRY